MSAAGFFNGSNADLWEEGPGRRSGRDRSVGCDLASGDFYANAFRSACPAVRARATPNNDRGMLDSAPVPGPSSERPPPARGCLRGSQPDSAQRGAKKVQGLEGPPNVETRVHQGGGRWWKVRASPSVPESRLFGEVTERDMHDAESRVRKYIERKWVARTVKVSKTRLQNG